MRVLYVEDDDNLAFAVEQMLKQDGHSCDRVRSGAGAVKLGQSNDYDVILLDVMLPDIDGYEVIRLLQGAGVDTPVLIQSGLVERDKAMDGLGFGVDDYLIKPFNRDELISQVRRAAARSGRVPATVANLPALVSSQDIAETEPDARVEPVISVGDESVGKKAQAAEAMDTANPTETASEPAAETTSEVATEAVTETAAETVPETVEEVVPETVEEAVPETVEEVAVETAAEVAAETATEVPAETTADADTAAADEDPPWPDSFPALPAKIVADEGRIDIDCIIVSVTSGGAVLNVHDELLVCPDDFKLAVAGDKSYRCQSCWRHSDKVGVKFV